MSEAVQLGVRPGGVDPIEALVQLIKGEPAVTRRLAQSLGDLVPVGVRGTDIALLARRGSALGRPGRLRHLCHGDSLERQQGCAA